MTTPIKVIPPETGPRAVSAVQGILESVGRRPISLEIVGKPDGQRFYMRSANEAGFARQVAAHLPRAEIRQLSLAEDHLRLKPGAQAWSMRIEVTGEPYLSIATIGDNHPPDDPLIGLLAALGSVHSNELLITRLRLAVLDATWFSPYTHLLESPATEQPHSTRSGPRPLWPLLLAGGAVAAGLGLVLEPPLLSEFSKISGSTLPYALSAVHPLLLGAGAGGVFGTAGVGALELESRLRRAAPPAPGTIDVDQFREKLRQRAFEACLEIIAVLPPGGREQRAYHLLFEVADAYEGFDRGGQRTLRATTIERVRSIDLSTAPDSGDGHTAVLGLTEAATLWHLPGSEESGDMVVRGGSRHIRPVGLITTGGALVGTTTDGYDERDVRFSDDQIRNSQFFVARSGMGKSTLMQHVVEHVLQRKAAGLDDSAVVVIDPHSDMVEYLLTHMPEELLPSIRLVDLGDDERYVPINLLDVRLFEDRDQTASDLTDMMAAQAGDSWGDRMAYYLRHAIQTLYEANESRSRDEQYTILDVPNVLENAQFRRRVLAAVSDVYLLDWWRSSFETLDPRYLAQNLDPALRRVREYASTRRTRAILGQPRSTIDIGNLISSGGVLLVSTAAGERENELGALVGASIINLVKAAIRKQGRIALADRRRVLLVVDELQAIGGVDYESMLSELRKFGLDMILVTQSLSRLDGVSRTLADTIFVNIPNLVAFQTSYEDATRLADEMGSPVTASDIARQPAHHAYVRCMQGDQFIKVFSMKTRPPTPGDPEMAARIRRAAHDYTIPF